MPAPIGKDERPPDEREIRTLSEQSGIAQAQVRSLFRHEHARLGMGAKVHSYLAVLTASNVRGMLRRVTQRREARQEACNDAQAPREPSNTLRAVEPRVEEDAARRRDMWRRRAGATQDVQSWEDDGGRLREAG
jgi:hypothetical protein